MKIAGVSILALALVIGILPQFTDCASQGREMILANGATAPMRCFWTAMAEIALAVPLALIGILMFKSKSKESGRILSSIGAVLGAFVILVPTVLIGVCPSSMMLCNSVMRPTLVLGGTLVAAVCLGRLFASERVQLAQA